MTWFIDDNRTWAQKIFGDILKCGEIPKHVALIMDGNRRFAREKNMQKIQGHISGFEKLVEALSWCFTMGIREVSVYAFSIENFKRSPDEVNGLFDLAREKFQRLLQEKEKIDELKVCVRIFGDISLLPKDLQKVIAQVMDMTKDNDNLFMNVYLAYTSRAEMTMAIKDICEGVKENKLELSDINEDLIDKCLYTSHSFEVDLLVRTSGEVRLSDFLLWQSSFSVLSFVKQMWPEFSIWNFYMGILNFQLNYDYIQKMRKKRDQKLIKDTLDQFKMIVIENRKELIEKIKIKDSAAEDLQALTKYVANEAIEKCLNERNDRCDTFLDELYTKRRNYIRMLAHSNS